MFGKILFTLFFISTSNFVLSLGVNPGKIQHEKVLTLGFPLPIGQIIDLFKEFDSVSLIPFLNIPLDFDLIRGNVKFVKPILSGFTKYDPSSSGSYRIFGSKLNFDLKFPNITFSSDYEIKSLNVLDMIKLKGKGSLAVIFENLQVKLEATLSMTESDQPLVISNVQFGLKTKLNFKITGLNGNENNSKAISHELTAVANHFLDEGLLDDLINNTDLIEGTINNLFKLLKLSPQTIMDFFKPNNSKLFYKIDL